MKIYHYNPTTGEFISEGRADSNPLEKGEILIPAFATVVQPPSVKENQIAVFSEGSWSVLPDQRGAEFWLPDGTFHKIKTIGEVRPDDALDSEPDLRTVDEVRLSAVALVHEKHAEFLRTLTGNATIEERDTWQAKALAAEAIQAGTASAIQQEMISTEASVVGETEEQLVQTILAKYGAYQKLIGLASGLRRKTEVALSAASNKEEIDQVLDASDEQSKQFVQQWQSGG